MNIDVYSDRAKQAIQAAQQVALVRSHQQFSPEHLAKALLDERDGPNGTGLARTLIAQAGGRPDEAVAAVDAALNKIPKVEGGSGQLYIKPQLARVPGVGDDKAQNGGH